MVVRFQKVDETNFVTLQGWFGLFAVVLSEQIAVDAIPVWRREEEREGE